MNFSVFFPNFYCVLFTQQQVGETKRPQGGEFPPGELSFWADAAIKAFANEGGSFVFKFPSEDYFGKCVYLQKLNWCIFERLMT